MNLVKLNLNLFSGINYRYTMFNFYYIFRGFKSVLTEINFKKVKLGEGFTILF